jgi:hypothetical protein
MCVVYKFPYMYTNIFTHTHGEYLSIVHGTASLPATLVELSTG